MIRAVRDGRFVYTTTANRGGKGEGAAALFIAMCQGRPFINGYHGKHRDLWREPIKIPRLKPPVIGVLAGESYKAMSLSSTFTVRKLLGSPDKTKWREEHAGNPDYVSLFRIRHADSRDESEWSLFYVFPYDGALPEGGGLDFWWCDEPPPVRFMSTLGSRIAAGRYLRQLITATPQEKVKWYPISKQFAEVGKNGHLTRWADRQVVGNRMRLKWSSEDNEALGETELKQLRENAKGRPFERSILYGDEVDTHGGCPWPEELLIEAMSNARPPIGVENLTIEGAADGTMLKAILHVYEHPIDGDPYYVVGDPAKGIMDGHHDPDGMHVRNRRTGALAARLVSHIGAWALGNVMADMHFRYNLAVCDPLVTGGYGIATVQAMRKRGVGSFTRTRKEVRPGEWTEEIGSTETEKMRDQFVEAIEREILTGKLVCPAAEVIQSMMDCTVDANGKVVSVYKKHLPEDLSCWGRYAVFSGEWEAPKAAKKPTPVYEDAVTRWKRKVAEADGAITREFDRRLEKPRDEGPRYDFVDLEP